MIGEFCTQIEAEIFLKHHFASWEMFNAKEFHERLQDLLRVKVLKPSQLAALHKLMGSVSLSRDNPVDAEVLIRNSLDYYNKIIEVCSDTLEELKSESRIHLARCMIRNYQKVEEAKKMARDEMFVNIRGDTLQKRINFINAALAMDELRCWQMTSTLILKELGTTALDWKQFSAWVEELNDKSSSPKIISEYSALSVFVSHWPHPPHFLSDQSVFRNVLFPRKFYGAHFTRAYVRFACISGQLHDNWVFSIPDNCDISQFECPAANMYYAHTMKMTSSLEDCLELLPKCLFIRSQKLGENNIETAKAKFQLGASKVLNGDKTKPMDEEGLRLMISATDLFMTHNSGLFDANYGALLLLGELFNRSGDLDKAVSFHKKAISLRKAYEDPHCFEPRGFIKLSCVYMVYHKWLPAICCLSEVLAYIEANKEEYYGSLLQCYSILGDCYFKLENFSHAQKFYDMCHEMLVNEPNQTRNFFTLVDHLSLAKISFVTSNSPENATKLFSEALELMENLKISHLGIYMSCAELWHRLENSPGKAQEMYKKGFDSGRQRVFQKHPYLCDCLMGLSMACLKQNNIYDAEVYAFKALQMALEIFDCNDSFFESLVPVFTGLLKHRKKMFKRQFVLQGFKDRFSKMGISQESIFIASLEFSFAKQSYEDGLDVEICAGLLQKSSEVFRRVFGPNSQRFGESEKWLGLCCLKLGYITKAESHLLNSATIESRKSIEHNSEPQELNSGTQSLDIVD